MISELLNKNGSDKCNKHTYQYVYNRLFGAFPKEYEIELLESGVEYGGSLSAWKEYFPNGRITGVDIKDVRKPEYERDDVEFVLSDIKDYKPDRKFDIIIEDGNHSNNDALWAAVNLSKHLKEWGTLIIEDVQEGFVVPFILWGQLSGDYIVEAIDMRRVTQTHDNFLVLITPVKVMRNERP